MGVLQMELENINKTILSEKSRKRQEQLEKQKLQEKLFNYFYNRFKKRQENFENIYIELNYIEERERILNKLTTSSLNFQYLNTIYNKTLKEVYQIFKTNYKYIEEQNKQVAEETQAEQEEYLKKLSEELQAIKEQEKQEKQKRQEQIEENKSKKNDIIILITSLSLVILPIVAIKNFGAFIILSIALTIIFSIINAIVKFLKQR